MRGFLERDLTLLLPSMKFYGVFIVVFAFIGLVSRSTSDFAGLYLLLFPTVGLMSLFSYDEMNRWQGYAAAAPNGRRAMVDARYLLTAGLSVVVFVLRFFLNLLDRSNAFAYAFFYPSNFFIQNALVFLSALLLYGAVVLPLLFRFGAVKARFFVILVGLLAGAVSIGGMVLSTTVGAEVLGALPTLLPTLLPLAAAGLFVLSWLLSRHIMDKKEL